MIRYALLAMLPWFLERRIRNLMGSEIEAGARIGPLSIVAVKRIRMARGARIHSLVIVKAEELELGRNARLRPLSAFRVRRLEVGRDSVVDPCVLVNCDFGPRSRLKLGRCVRVFSFSVLEPSEGIMIDDQTGLGGQCLIFCHGSWPSYLDGAPYARGPVRLGRDVWIPWRVMILPNVEVGDGAVIGAHSLVRSNVPPRSLFSGVPAKLIASDVWTPIADPAERLARLDEVIASFHAFHEGRFEGRVAISPAPTDGLRPTAGVSEVVLCSFTGLSSEATGTSKAPDVTMLDFTRGVYLPGGPIGAAFVAHLATFGVRLSSVDTDEI